MSTVAAASRLGRIARDAARRRAEPPASTKPEPEPERCDLCGAPVAPEHRHLRDRERGELLCACRACSLLFDRGAAGGGHRRLVPDRRLALPDLDLPAALWHRLRVPVAVAFFVPGPDGVTARYPGPLGATEARPDAEAWAGLVARNPALETLEEEVEALLVRRAAEPRNGRPEEERETEAWIVPIDDAYALVGEMRRLWRGLAGGTEVWSRLDAFFAELRRRARPAPAAAAPAPRSSELQPEEVRT